MKFRSAALAVLLTLTTASACTGGDSKSGRGSTVSGEDGAPSVTVTPGDGTSRVRPDSRVSVTAGGGTLAEVTVRTGGGLVVAGGFTADRTGWRASRGLKPDAAYEVTAKATRGGKTTTVTSRFRTLKPGKTFGIADITPMSDRSEKIGVGAPIIVTFDRPVSDRAAVERALEVKAQKPVEGAWRWVSSTQVVYRTKKYWPAHQKVRFTARLTGVAAAKGVYGVADVSRRFAVGAAQISTVNSRTHRMTVRRDGRVIRTLPVSLGSGGRVVNGEDIFLTASGVHLVMDKKRVERMTSAGSGIDPKDKINGWDTMVNWAVRISASGEYVHQSNGQYQYLGNSNQSHGCVRTTPDGAQWFFGIAQRGDVVDVTGTARRLPWTNGWSYWQLSWKQWRSGSALA
ncbi:L,D-transpeptidase [Actinomadura rudentiformis]|uniref:L,D-transpeptidase n=1 Tax=Actinomadura rudentiformis TaxID=359158 RepID=A0A6H9YZZ5_9ACTN|nr:Ig-like domain-containing protein [Actinomadura rudentiformis]KAB2350927.1 L,D-transpeptidase [Actinomadura rudentiformis]